MTEIRFWVFLLLFLFGLLCIGKSLYTLKNVKSRLLQGNQKFSLNWTQKFPWTLIISG